MTTMIAAGLLALGASHDAEADIGSKSDGRHHNRRSRRSSRRSHRRRHSDRSTRAHRHRLANRRFGRRRLARSRIARSDSGGFDFSRRRRRLRRANRCRRTLRSLWTCRSRWLAFRIWRAQRPYTGRSIGRSRTGFLQAPIRRAAGQSHKTLGSATSRGV